jgi:hypothetical protein
MIIWLQGGYPKHHTNSGPNRVSDGASVEVNGGFGLSQFGCDDLERVPFAEAGERSLVGRIVQGDFQGVQIRLNE